MEQDEQEEGGRKPYELSPSKNDQDVGLQSEDSLAILAKQMALVPYEEDDGDQNGEAGIQDAEDIDCEIDDVVELQEVDINEGLTERQQQEEEQ
jgi:hypothetical protein